MAERLGHVLFWLGMIIGVPLLGLALYAANYAKDGPMVAIIVGGPGLAAVLIGWACRFVLAGR
jgi:hypothetical protein